MTRLTRGETNDAMFTARLKDLELSFLFRFSEKTDTRQTTNGYVLLYPSVDTTLRRSVRLTDGSASTAAFAIDRVIRGPIFMPRSAPA